MNVDVDPSSAVPAYEQVRSQLAEMIRSGVLPEGTRLAPIRQLSADLALAPGTVARVYQELEAEGLVTSRVGHGTVVASAKPLPADESEQSLRAAARSYAALAARLGRSEQDAERALRREWAGLNGLSSS